MKIRMIAIAGMCMIGLAACGSAASTSAPATTTTTTASHPAVASPPPTTAAAAPVDTPASPSPTTAPATTPAAASATPGSVKTVTLWCGTQNLYTQPSLSTWENGGDDTIDDIKRTVAYIESPQVQANPWAVYALQLCGEVLSADAYPPPVDQSTWASAMSDFLQAADILHSAPGAPAVSTARPYLNSGSTKLNAFLAAVGISQSI
jgi:hypothetical protein